MIEIKGKFNTAICYTKNIEDIAFEQIKNMCDYKFTEGSIIRIMPDVHAGKGCTIGTTMTIKDMVVPNIVGVDIGCGMYVVKLGNIGLNLKEVDEIVHKIPSGMSVWSNIKEDFDLTILKCYEELKNYSRLQKSLGTLGGGNHFIEIDIDKDMNKYLIIHSGSRNLGKQVAEYYQEVAINERSGIVSIKKAKEELIQRLKAEGRFKEIQSSLDEFNSRVLNPDMPKELCYLSGDNLKDYLYDIKICQSFAKRNRELIAEIILKDLDINIVDSFHTIHNYIDTDEMILRKGAIAAHRDELVLIPINMRDGCILARGKGNPDWNYSAPHGAGRIMSRAEAIKMIKLEDYKEAMEGIYTTSVNSLTIDEAPMAYKAIEDIIDSIKESVDIIDVLKPIYNFKAN